MFTQEQEQRIREIVGEVIMSSGTSTGFQTDISASMSHIKALLADEVQQPSVELLE